MPYKFSPSSLSLLKECERCFWLQFRLNLKRPDGIFPTLPSGMDRILKNHFDRFKDKKMMPPELARLEGYTLFEHTDLLEEWRDYLRGIRWKDKHGNVIMGAIDNILMKGKKLVILDYKTRGHALRDGTANYYKDQMDIYNFLFRKNGYETEDYSYLLFYHPDKVLESGEVIFHSDLVKISVSIQNAERIIQKAIEILSGELPKANEHCLYCKWQQQKIVMQTRLNSEAF